MAEEEGNFFTDAYDNYIRPGYETIKNIGREFSDATGLGWDDAKNAAKFAAAGYLNKTGFTDQEIARSGYQGKVPKFTAVRERVPFTYDPNRRAGSGGQRYFTGTRYIGDPSGASGLPSQRQELYGVERMDEDMSAGGLEYLKARQEALQPAIDEVERVRSEIFAVQDRYGIPRGTGSIDANTRQLIADKLGVVVGDPAVQTAVDDYNTVTSQTINAENTLSRARGEFDNYNMDPTGRLSRYGTTDSRGLFPLSSVDPALGYRGIGSSQGYMYGVEGSTGTSPYMNYTIDDGYIKDAEGNIIDATGSRVAKFGDPTVGTQFYDTAAQDAYMVDNPNAEFNPDGYLMTAAENPKQLGSLYTDEGYAISTPAKDFTNYEVARGVGQQEAMGLAAINAFNPYSGSAGNTSPTPFPVGTSPYFSTGGQVGLMGQAGLQAGLAGIPNALEIDYEVNPNPNQVFSDADYADAGPPPRVDRVVKPDESYFDDRIKEIENRNQPNIAPEQEQTVRAMNQARFTGGFRPQGLPSLPKRPPAMPTDEEVMYNIPIYPMMAGPDGVATHSNIPYYRHPDGTLKKYPFGGEDPGYNRPHPSNPGYVPPFKITPEQEQAVRAMNQARFSGGFRKPPHKEPIDIPFMDRPDPSNPNRYKPDPDLPPRTTYAAGGGVKQLAGGRYLDGMTDGMADEVPSSIDGVQPAALSDGEFVIPADVVSHLGNGSSNAGAKVLNDMMSNVRETRTGNPEQGKQINPQRVMQSSGLGNFANGGQVKKFNTGDVVNNTIDSQPGLDLTTGDDGGGDNSSDSGNEVVDSNNASGSGDSGDDVVDTSGIDTKTGYESSLSNWVGETVTDMLGRGEALSKRDYEAYYGPLSAGEDYLQRQAYDAAAGIDTSGAGLGSFTADRAAQYMNPFVQQALEPQLREARRQAEIDRLANAGRMTQAGSYGGSRQAILEAEGLRNLGTRLGDITSEGYQTAYDKAAQQFGDDRQFGLDALQQQADMGASRRDILSEGIAADKAQFEEERDYDYKAVQYLQSLLQDLPIKSQSYDFAQPSDAADIAGLVAALGGADNIDLLDTLLAVGSYGVDKVGDIFGGGASVPGDGSTAAVPGVPDVPDFSDVAEDVANESDAGTVSQNFDNDYSGAA